jgi:NADPH-dependent glutamate synthase beta subunit-like oxidoreductase/dihydroorotate dehydrogenase/Pyruvate/2-oxoacid:ferredoxin oxidoreductase delta subunit
MMPKFLTDAKLARELDRCEYCEEKPCKAACPADCSPADFIIAAKLASKGDYKRAANVIMRSNPLGGVCGAVCPDRHCMSGCVHKTFDRALNIPMLQATIVQKAKDLLSMPEFKQAKSNGKTVAVIGAGPAGLAAAAALAQKGYQIAIYEKANKAGGACNYIPDFRLDKEVLRTDIDFVKALGDIKIYFGKQIANAEDLLRDGDGDVAAVIVSSGLDAAAELKIPGSEHVIAWDKYLGDPAAYQFKNKRIAVIGGGAVAADCAVAAKKSGASRVDLICLENNADMLLTAHERELLHDTAIVVLSKTAVTSISKHGDDKLKFEAATIDFPKGGVFKPEQIIPGTSRVLHGYDAVIAAVGSRSTMPRSASEKVFYAGDIVNGPTSVVEAVASGKNAACRADGYLTKKPCLQVAKDVKSTEILAGKIERPISLETDFFGRKIISPFILSAAPPTDGYENMKRAYDAGWAGGVMKTAFDNLPIHIPGEYMFVFDDNTYANCDNVSGHHLDRVCAEIEKLVKEYPDRLTIGSTGGPVTGNDEADKKVWQSNTKKLERAGSMAVEYSLSCPQGGDGTEGDIVSQNPKLTAKIIDWVMEVSDPEVPKLFKLTGAVTSIYPIVDAIRKVFAKYSNKKAGITLANSFPTLAFRKGAKTAWEEGVVTGASGEGVKHISYLTLANVAHMGVDISGNGGPMDYKGAADFLALGCKTVQFCTIALKYGVHVIDELHNGLSYLMQERGFKSVADLIGCALPNPVTGFMELSPIKKISTVIPELCEHCGNCTRCPYMAIKLDVNKVPMIDPAKCIGCSICAKKCFSKALYLRDRTPEEAAMLSEE